jgi:DNA polymerase type B, organellar and viral
MNNYMIDSPSDPNDEPLVFIPILSSEKTPIKKFVREWEIWQNPTLQEQPNIEQTINQTGGNQPVENITSSECSNPPTPKESTQNQTQTNTTELNHQITEHLKLVQTKTQYNKKFRSNTTKYKFEISNPTIKTKKFLHEMFEQILTLVKQNVNSGDKIGLVIDVCDREESPKAIGVPINSPHNIKTDVILDLFEAVAQSNTLFNTANQLIVHTTVIKDPTGGVFCKNSSALMTTEEILTHKKCLLNIKLPKGYNLCLITAIIIAEMLAIGESLKSINKMKKNQQKLIRLSKTFLKRVKIELDFTNDLMGINCIHKIQKYLQTKYRLVIFNNHLDPNSILYKGPQKYINSLSTLSKIEIKHPIKDLYIYFCEKTKHFYPILSLQQLFSKQNAIFCKICDKLINRQHKCLIFCQFCRKNCIHNTNEMVFCNSCSRYFNGSECYTNHKIVKNKKSVCDIIRFCTRCNKLYNLEISQQQEHKCDHHHCQNCEQYVSNAKPHPCFIKKIDFKNDIKYSLIFFDFETKQEKQLSDTEKEHEPNLCTASKICYECSSIEDDSYSCKICKKRNYSFFNDTDKNCVEKFVDFCTAFDPNIKKTFIFAHNFKAYDGIFIINQLVKNKKKFQPIMNGLKILAITFDTITFLDTLNFIPIPLSKFNSAFGLKEDESKMFYPYLFNTTENESYIGPMPDKKFYCLNNMSLDRLTKFNTEYDAKIDQNYVFNNMVELERYCAQDTKVLRLGAVRFMKNFESITGINPFLHSITLAHATLNVYRNKFMPENSIAIMEKSNYRIYEKSSFIADKWLIYENSKLQNGEIQTALHPLGEYKTPLGGVVCDGYHKEENTCYFFDGCYFHGCCVCFYQEDLRKQHNMDLKQENTILRDLKLKKFGYKVVTMKECDFNTFLYKNPELSKKLDNNPTLLLGPINIRDSLMGGRTEVFKMYHECKPGEQIRYIDYVSLYSYVMSKKEYGIGQPVSLLGRKEANKIVNDIPNMMGIVRCTILPPKNLYFPVLPMKAHNKLFFSLCRTCTHELNFLNKCNHTDAERALHGTFTTIEIKEALKRNYKILDVVEFWKYEKTNDLFNNFITTFLKEKIKNSGWGEVETESEKLKFFNDLKKEGIELQEDEIVDNPTMRFISKLILNSLWGRLSMNPAKPQSSIVYDTHEFLELIFNESIEVSPFMMFFEESVWVNWRYKNDFEKPQKTTAVQIGSWTTAHARVELYNLLSDLKESGNTPIYIDTDSCFYISKDGAPYSREGSNLGQLTNELAKYSKTAYIKRMVCLAPKTYSMEIYIPETDKFVYETACKGFTLGPETKDKISFESLREILFDPLDDRDRCVEYINKIKRTRNFKIVSENQKKKLQFSFLKRVVTEDLDSFPFGYENTT